MKDLIQRTISALILGAFFWISFIYFPPFVFSMVLIGILMHIVFVELKHVFPNYSNREWFFIPLYPIVPFGLLLYLNHNEAYRNLLFVLFIIVSSLDMGSYLIGSLFGKHKIAPEISPKKTWEGFAGGYLFSCIGLVWILWEMGKLKPWWFVASFSFGICALALLGDLFESWLKREAGVKDSGTILPGHGGFLDRFDGILFAVFFFFFLRDWLIALF